MAAKIYEVYDNEKYIGSYTPKVAEKIIGIPRSSVQMYAKGNMIYHKRYRFELGYSELTMREYDKKLEEDLKLTARFLILASKAGWKLGN